MKLRMKEYHLNIHFTGMFALEPRITERDTNSITLNAPPGKIRKTHPNKHALTTPYLEYPARAQQHLLKILYFDTRLLYHIDNSYSHLMHSPEKP